MIEVYHFLIPPLVLLSWKLIRRNERSRDYHQYYDEDLSPQTLVMAGRGGVIFCNPNTSGPQYPNTAEDIYRARAEGFTFQYSDEMDDDEVVVFSVEELCQISRL